MKPAGRMEGLRLSPIRAMSEGAPPDCVSLGLGEPSWDLPLPAREALADWARREAGCSYGPNAGTQELREALAGLLGASDSEILVSSGSQGALFALVHAWAGPGDQVLLPDPGFTAYPTLARLTGAETVPYPLSPDYSLDPDSFRSTLRSAPRARLAIINHPANPTGAGASRGALDSVHAACLDRRVVLVSDEVYRELYLSAPPEGLADSGVLPGAVVLGSMSKAFGAPGLRVGWALGDSEVLAPARLVHNAMVSCLARPAQAAAAALAREARTVLRDARTALAERWRAFRGAASEFLDLDMPEPAGGFYAWLALPDAGRADPLSFCIRIRDEGRVVVVPGSAFGQRGASHARISWAGSPSGIREGV
ncbi:MAG TPA: pyridoxal phosphate-dependent aminotransferase, partial [Magnetospirillaceae bacterium]|nr:pyridoxal phosphate-dependent aminotransferase [Magnetospirillaceae bacterium]